MGHVSPPKFTSVTQMSCG